MSKKTNKILGNKGEKIAENYLKNKNYKIIKKNFRNQYSEIDIIAQSGDYIVLIEVKTKSNSSFGEPEEMVNFYKKQKLIKAAKYFYAKYPKYNIRIDVIAISIDNNKINHYINAVDEII